MPDTHTFDESFDASRCTLAQLCNFVVTMEHPYEDLAEQIEDKAYAECENGGFYRAVGHIEHIAAFFEHLENKNEEVCRDLADVYVLLGEIHLCAGGHEESRTWFEKAIVVDDAYDVPYHSLANSFVYQGMHDEAIRCWEQEIRVAPGNYFTYLLLADMYEKQGNEKRFVEVLEALLERNPGNIRALHRLIQHHQLHNPTLNVELLRRRLITADHGLVKTELVIWTYHMCAEQKYEDALWFLDRREEDAPGLIITHLLKAHIYGRLRQYTKKKRELSEFRRLCHGRDDLMRTKLEEFRSVFGDGAAERLAARLAIARASSAGPQVVCTKQPS